MSNNDETVRVLRSLIQVLHDGHKMMADVGDALTNEAAKRFCLGETQVRSGFAAELENELHRLGVHDVNEGGTTAGSVHRAWADVKAKLGGGDRTLLDTAEEGEDEIKRQYADALQEKLPGNVLNILRSQQTHILTSHEMIRDFRDASAA